MKKHILYTLALLIYSSVLSQELQTIVPPSPTVASLGKYADLPVGLYTGTPQISVPLYTITDKDISIPISLSYNASGIRANEEASWVGLGWSLNAGGVITRLVRGNDDLGAFASSGYPESETLVDSENFDPFDDDFNINADNQRIVKNIALYKTNDAEPDIFYYNFAGKSGKFYLDKVSGSPDVYRATLEKNEGLKITYTKSTKSWTIVDINGMIYNFNIVEKTTPRGTTNQSPLDDFFDSMSQSSSVISSWYLNEVVSRTGGKITLNYDTAGVSKSQLHRGQKFVKISWWNSFGCVNRPSPYEYTLSREYYRSVYLREIISSNGRVEFTRSVRNDILSGGETSPQKLDKVHIYQTGASTPLKTFALNYDYFKRNSTDTDTRYLRLKLKEVQEMSGSEVIPPYVFSYHEVNNIPSKLTMNIDHWGYWNGKNNDGVVPGENEYFTNKRGMLIPPFRHSYIDIYGTRKVFNYKGADREPNIDYTKVFTMNRIKYPTSGTHDFDYELNEYGNILPYTIEEQKVTLISEELCNMSQNCYGNPSSVNKTFEITQSTIPGLGNGKFIKIEYTVDGLMPSGTVRADPFIYIYKVTERPNSGYVQYYPHHDDFVNYPNGSFLDYEGGQDNIYLEPGEYKIEILSAPETIAFVDITTIDLIKTPVKKKKGAGLRLKKLTIKDNTGGKDMIKKYKYSKNVDNSTSTGVLMSEPRYFSDIRSFSLISYLFSTSHHGSCNLSGEFISGGSSSVTPLSRSASGSYIGYSMVEEIFGENGENGIKKHYFKNYEDDVYENLGAPSYKHLDNGLKIKEEYLDKNLKKVKVTEYNYSKDFNTAKHVYGLYVERISDYAPSSGFNDFPLSLKAYGYPIEWWKLDSVTTTDFLNDKEYVTQTNYEIYNKDNQLPEKISFRDSKNRLIETEKKYATSYSNDDTSFGSNLLRNASMLTSVLELSSKTDGIIVNKKNNTYKTIGKMNNLDIIVPTVQTYIPKNSISNSKNIQYSYHSNGNLREVSMTNGAITAYIWGYNDQYPIAKIENATYNQIASHITDLKNKSNDDDDHCRTTNCKEQILRNALQELRNALPNAMVSTYTYDPLIGVTSMTAPNGYTTYYKYDGFNRLDHITDADAKVLKKYNYNYKGQLFANYPTVSASIDVPALVLNNTTTNANIDISGGSGKFDYAWTLSGQTIATSTKNITHNFTSVGEYTLACIVTDLVTDQEITLNQSIRVFSPLSTPTLTTSATHTTPDIGTQLTTLVSGGSGDFEYRWYVNGAINVNSTTPQIDKKFRTPGTYTIKVEVHDKQIPNYFKEASITIYNHTPLTIPSITLNPNSSPNGTSKHYMVGSTVTLTGTNLTGGSGSKRYEWYIDNVKQSNTSTTISKTNTAKGYHSFMFKVIDNNIPNHSKTGYITLYFHNPISSIGSIQANAGYTINDDQSIPITITSASGGSGSYKYQWFVDNTTNSSQTSTSRTFSFSHSRSAYYTIYCRVIDAKSGFTTGFTSKRIRVTVNQRDGGGGRDDRDEDGRGKDDRTRDQQ